MNEDTKFLLNRIDQVHTDLTKEVGKLREAMLKEFKELQAFKNRTLGMMTLASILIGTITTLVVEYITRR